MESTEVLLRVSACCSLMTVLFDLASPPSLVSERAGGLWARSFSRFPDMVKDFLLHLSENNILSQNVFPFRTMHRLAFPTFALALVYVFVDNSSSGVQMPHICSTVLLGDCFSSALLQELYSRSLCSRSVDEVFSPASFPVSCSLIIFLSVPLSVLPTPL